MQQLSVTYRRIAELVPYDRNARTHSEAQIAQIAAAIRAFGWTNPVLIDERSRIIAGHGRVAAGSLAGMDEVPTICIEGLTDAQRRALIIADNKLALNAGWDEVLLAGELQALQAEDFAIGLIGFTAADLEAMTDFGGAGGQGGAGSGSSGAGSLAERFMIPPFSVLNAREGWWQDRKRAWLALGIKSELGRGDAHSQTNASPQSMEYAGGFSARHGASPGGSPRPAADYSKRQRGNGAGKAIA